MISLCVSYYCVAVCCSVCCSMLQCIADERVTYVCVQIYCIQWYAVCCSVYIYIMFSVILWFVAVCIAVCLVLVRHRLPDEYVSYVSYIYIYIYICKMLVCYGLLQCVL